VSSPKDKKVAPADEEVRKQKRKKEKLIQLDDLIPKGDVSGGRQYLFGTPEPDQKEKDT
jgi:hypothetical protein